MLFRSHCNKSWFLDQNPEALPKTEVNPTWSDPEEAYCYNISADHLRTWYTRKLVDSMGIGEIDMPDSLPITI